MDRTKIYIFKKKKSQVHINLAISNLTLWDFLLNFFDFTLLSPFPYIKKLSS